MRIVDLTHKIVFPSPEADKEDYHIPLSIKGRAYKALCHKLRCDGMSGTYLDFPGHVVETDDGLHAGNCPLEDLFMLPATFLRLNREGKGREVTADALEAAGAEVRGKALIVHALGDRGFFDYTNDTIPFFGDSAVGWILDKGVKVFASDIYENKLDPRGIFTELFAAGTAAVCCPVNLQAVRATYLRVCVVPLRMEGAVQLPCRFFVVEG